MRSAQLEAAAAAELGVAMSAGVAGVYGEAVRVVHTCSPLARGVGQKVHPYGFRLGFNKPWRSRWFAKQGYAKLLQEDLELKEDLRSRLKSAGVSSIEVDRPGNKLRVTIRTSRPTCRPSGISRTCRPAIST